MVNFNVFLSELCYVEDNTCFQIFEEFFLAQFHLALVHSILLCFKMFKSWKLGSILEENI